MEGADFFPHHNLSTVLDEDWYLKRLYEQTADLKARYMHQQERLIEYLLSKYAELKQLQEQQ